MYLAMGLIYYLDIRKFINMSVMHKTNSTIKIALLIPAKSNQTELSQTELIRIFLPSFISSVSNKYRFTLYIGADAGDLLFKEVERVAAELTTEHIDVKLIEFPEDIEKGHLTRMWNILFQSAYDEGNDYFYQCGDNILFFHKNWIEASIEKLEKSKGVGVSGPTNPYDRNILTQTFVSRRHMDIFGYYFPETIRNYWCDDWINSVYKTCFLLFKLKSHSLYNTELAQRYVPDESKIIYMQEVHHGIKTLNVSANKPTS
jgi:hypothetical protein